jgi:hypothetical protein
MANRILLGVFCLFISLEQPVSSAAERLRLIIETDA